MTSTRFVLPLAALALAALTAAAPPDHEHPAPPPGADSLLARADSGRIEGSPTAKVWVIEASDFQCPYCKEWHDQSYKTILDDYVKTGKIRFAFLNDPLSIHQHSVQAAEAAMCASAQGKFWPMHQELFATQNKWDGPANPAAFFDSLAVKAGVNAPEWRRCVNTHAMQSLIEADQSRLRSAGVQATPTFFVGGRMLEGVQPMAAMRQAIDEALAKAGAK